jgi:hypothetical protein
MEKLVRDLSWKPNAIDKTAAGKAKLKVYRTVHGLVTHYGTSNGKKVAYVTARTTYLHEADSIVGFRRFNQPDQMRLAEEVPQVGLEDPVHLQLGLPERQAHRVLPVRRLPQAGQGHLAGLPGARAPASTTGRASTPRPTPSDLLAFDKHPKTKNQDVMVSWNNKPAKDWAAADEQWGLRAVLPLQPDRGEAAGGRSVAARRPRCRRSFRRWRSQPRRTSALTNCCRRSSR